MTTAIPLGRRSLAAGLLVAFVLAVAPLATLAGCGRGYYYSPHVGTLEVRNSPSSDFVIEFIDISVPLGPVDRHTVFLTPGERETIDLQPDSYDIDIYWSNGDVHSYYNYDIFDGDYRVITGIN